MPRAGFASDRNNLAPRVGAAWKPFGLPSTVVRGGYGLFYDVGILNLNTLPRFNPPHFSFDLVVGPRPLEDVFAAGALTFNQVNTIDPELRDAYCTSSAWACSTSFGRICWRKPPMSALAGAASRCSSI